MTSVGGYATVVPDSVTPPSRAPALLVDGDERRTRAALGLTISHCTIVLQANEERHAAWGRQPYWEGSPASGDSLYHVDEVVHEELEYEEWVNQAWAAVLAMLNGAANLSKLFYGAGFGNAQKNPEFAWIERQRADLRDILLPGSAVDSASRMTRDAFEHIDERLWARLIDIKDGQAVPEVVRFATGSREEWEEFATEPPLGLYDHAGGLVWFWDRSGREVSTNLEHLVEDVARIKERAIGARQLIA